MSKQDKIYIFDTTLRDGEQAPGFSMSIEAKLNLARQLAKLKVDAIEAGFPVSSPVQFEAVKRIAKTVRGPRILGLARAVKKDIDVCYESVKHAPKHGIHTFIATSDIHMRYKLQKTPKEVLNLASESVKYACSLVDYVEFSAEDATRSQFEFLCEIVDLAIKSGARSINIPDTVGYAIPSDFGQLIRRLIENIPDLGKKVVLSVHCHNDLGLGVSNSLSAIQNGANQIECTINGIGERAGNAALEEIVMALKVRKDIMNKMVSVESKQIYPTSRLLTILTGVAVQPNKAIVGENAFAHESGIHQDGMLKARETYEIMTPQSVGRTISHIVLGRHSGRHGFIKCVQELGYKLNEKEMEDIYKKFLEVADKKKQIYDDDLVAIIESELKKSIKWYRLEYFHVLTGINVVPSAVIKLKKGKEIYSEAAYGDGPIDAIYNAIDKIVRLQPKLEDYIIKSLSGGKEAMGEVRVIISYKNNRYFGIGSSTDIIEASAISYINAINRCLMLQK
ncbi:MAG: 2-isopropylmalate synthase [Spirochaetes bacterium]|nr:2-isopropylmalate synthase [Spirochaetota bacterium]